MEKISKTVPQKEKASSSRPAGDKAPVETRIKECVLGSCDRTSDFKVEKPSSVPGRCLEDVAEMRPPPLGEQEVPKPSKEKKRKRVSSSDTPKPKKRKARKHRSFKAIEPVTVEEAHLQIEEISEDYPRKVLESSEAEDVYRRDEQSVVTLHQETFSKSRAELNRCEADLKRLTEERDALKLLYVQKGEEIRDLRAELAIAHKEQTDLIEQVRQKAEKIEQLCEEAKMKEAETFGWKQNMDHLASKKDTARAQLSSVERQLQSMKEESLARAKKIEELKTRLAAELAKAASEAERVKANAEAVVAVYRADAEVANARAKEISDVAQVRLSCIAEHAKCQSQRETLEEIHARGFDLMADIVNAKVLEAEAKAEAFLSGDYDSGSASGSESGEDKDGAPGED
ncbi:PREDICTED: cilia- and flagella-associated protein 58-like [Nicotiana attenuata]|uniref:cilia- and flagella-associated protein 58-like n=1 Tax=Nicotiana attenuata TaxID=49451 RepID=UPI000905D6D5|nr:PREDICTED: cilia- and flagella-associated protein 58-like [Nicotiana attenuata]